MLNELIEITQTIGWWKILTLIVIPSGIISALISSFVNYFFNKKLEKHRFSQLKRQKAEAVAKLFSKWIKYRGKETVHLTKLQQFDYYEELNHMSIEMALWIEDEALLNKIMCRLQNKEGAQSVNQLIVDVRKLILDKKNDKFSPEEVVLWPEPSLLEELLKKDDASSL